MHNTSGYCFLLTPKTMKITTLVFLGITVCFASVATASHDDPDHEGQAKFFVLKEQKVTIVFASASGKVTQA